MRPRKFRIEQGACVAGRSVVGDDDFIFAGVECLRARRKQSETGRK
jgi:hypothetical protein